MKKIFFLMIALCFVLSACGNVKKPDNISQEMYDSAVYVIDVVDLYINGNETLEQTYDKLDNMNMPEADIDGEYSEDFGIHINISSIKTDLFGLRVGTTSLSDLKEDRNELAKAINYK